LEALTTCKKLRALHRSHHAALKKATASNGYDSAIGNELKHVQIQEQHVLVNNFGVGTSEKLDILYQDLMTKLKQHTKQAANQVLPGHEGTSPIRARQFGYPFMGFLRVSSAYLYGLEEQRAHLSVYSQGFLSHASNINDISYLPAYMAYANVWITDAIAVDFTTTSAGPVQVDITSMADQPWIPVPGGNPWSYALLGGASNNSVFAAFQHFFSIVMVALPVNSPTPWNVPGNPWQHKQIWSYGTENTHPNTVYPEGNPSFALQQIPIIPEFPTAYEKANGVISFTTNSFNAGEQLVIFVGILTANNVQTYEEVFDERAHPEIWVKKVNVSSPS